jgi:hypothetical protein
VQQKNCDGFAILKISLANFAFRIYFMAGRSTSGLFVKESQNGLEDPEDRRSIGGHGNQHVRLRRPQVSGSDSFTLNLKVDRRE